MTSQREFEELLEPLPLLLAKLRGRTVRRLTRLDFPPTLLSLVIGKTAGSVPYVSSGLTLTEDNTILAVDAPNKRVGIRTTAPNVALTVISAGSLPTSYDNANTAEFFSDIDGDALFILSRGGLANPQQLWFGVNQAGLFSPIQAVHSFVGYDALALNPHGGNVGIGTASPATNLDVNGTMRTVGIGTVPASGVGLEAFYFSGAGYILCYDRTGSAFKPLTLSGSPISLMQGNVGIGTESPQALFHVGGPNTVGDIWIDTPNSPYRAQLYFTKNGVLRWLINKNDDTESGANAGSNLEIINYDDSGTYLTKALTMLRKNGYLGIGATNPAQALDVAGKVHISDLTTAGATAVTHSGNVLGTVASDERLKKNIQIIPNALDIVKKIDGVFYEWKEPGNDPGRHVGITAQNLLKVLPELTFQQSVRDEEPYYGVHYERVCALLIEAVKEQQTQIDELKAEVTKLKSK